jgi:hypothetical protein
LYGKPAGPDVSYSIYDHVGYFHPRSEGSYTFVGSNLDEDAFIWFGDKAASKTEYTNANAENIYTYYGSDSERTYTLQITSDQVGTYIPIRILFVNSATCGRWTFDINGPNGVVMSKTASNGEIVRGCDAEPNSPPFPV